MAQSIKWNTEKRKTSGGSDCIKFMTHDSMWPQFVCQFTPWFSRQTGCQTESDILFLINRLIFSS